MIGHCPSIVDRISAALPALGPVLLVEARATMQLRGKHVGAEKSAYSVYERLNFGFQKRTVPVLNGAFPSVESLLSRD